MRFRYSRSRAAWRGQCAQGESEGRGQVPEVGAESAAPIAARTKREGPNRTKMSIKSLK
jgi:hypothetical protein